MGELVIFLGVFALLIVLSGPIALVVGLILLSRVNELERRAKSGKPRSEPDLQGAFEKQREEKPVFESMQEALEEPTVAVKSSDALPLQLVEVPSGEQKQELLSARVDNGKRVGLLEQRIGTQWVLIAGIITVIFGVGFFLKFAYDNQLIGPLGRVVIAGISGLLALVIGEVTRRRGYDVVAKGVTALGFAILYVTDFSAYRYYELIGTAPAFVLAIFITVAAMIYAVGLNEILIAFLSLFGGFLTPIIVSTGENLPIPLFSYVLILGVGAVLCAYYRHWRAVNLLAFVGTFLLYAGWFEKFYRPVLSSAAGAPEQMAIAIGWLAVFFVVYLLLPILYGLVRKVKSQQWDVLLVLGNAAIAFFYLWSILFDSYRVSLALGAVGLCAAHLIMMAVVMRRYEDDVNLRAVLLALGLFFLTIAVPLYLKMYAVAMAWAAEGVILAIIGLRYNSIRTQVGAAVAFSLSLGWLLHQLPMHTEAFRVVFNPEFGTWCFVIVMLIVCDLLYRKNLELSEDLHEWIPQIFYGTAGLLMFAVVTMEWWWHCDYNLAKSATENSFIKGMVIIFTVFPLLFLVRPVCPRGVLAKVLAVILWTVGSVFAMSVFPKFYKDSFIIFANVDFGIVTLFVGGLFVGALLLKRAVEEEYNLIFAALFALAGLFVLWVLLTEEIYLYWYCRNRFAERIANWMFLAQMYISVMWAVYGVFLMVAGFWHRNRVLRYLALGLFALLLAKVFIFDTSEVKSVYRITAFLATGITLVGVSYLYQFLKNRGFFEAMLMERGGDK